MRLKSIVVVVAAVVAVAAALPAGASPPLPPGEMIVYRAGERVPESQLADLGPPEALGGTVLEGDPRISARIDHADGDVVAGVFQATRGKVLVDFPFTEHATIIDGEVELTDQWGNTARLGAGDSYFIRQGSVIVWDVRAGSVQKSFFNRTEEQDAPAPMRVYRVGDEVPDAELASLGSPEDLGGTVLSGDPELSGRIDHGDGTMTAGVFQATRGDVRVRFPFTEHATVTVGSVTLTDETGRVHRFLPGDSYLIRQQSTILWEVAQRRVQKTFFNLVER